ncbi:CPBP family intramembrane glutamic endopeptidase [Palleronia caenipelagi]|nr:CPBP family intramembrane glutamic endopeptidase [Palleronia caenipelagi]
MTYQTALERYIAPARTRPQFWRLLAGTLTMLLVYLLGLLALGAVLVWHGGEDGALRMMSELMSPVTPAGTLLLLATFAGMALGPMLAVRLWHRRSVGSLFGPRTVVMRDFLRAGALIGTLLALSITVWSQGFDAVPGLPFDTWIGLLPVALPLILLQTGAEELVFRGYLLQQLAARFRSPWVWLVLPSVIFGALHYDPGSAGDNALFVAASATLFGLMAADLTRVTGSLGAAWGLHFVNNVVALLFVATDGTITGLALHLTPYTAAEMGASPLVMVGDLATTALVWALMRWWLRRRTT